MDRSSQVPFFKIGQLGPYLKADALLECPKDVFMRQRGRFSQLYRARAIKLTSYEANGAISGYGGKQVPHADQGATWKISGFTGRDILMWESYEMTEFNFNAAAFNPADPGIAPSRRHLAGYERAFNFASQLTGQVPVARAGGGAEFLNWRKLMDLRAAGRRVRPNEILCGPGFR